MPRSHPEIILQKQCVQYLRLLPTPPVGPFWTAVNPIPMSSPRLGKLAKEMGQIPGFPDFIIAYQATPFVIELKPATGALSANQKYCHRMLEQTGIRVFVCRSLESFIGAIQEIMSETKVAA